jgi:hypothetical protein
MVTRDALKGMRNALNMSKQRCRNPNNRDYKYYGGRGIKVCDRWDNFDNFLSDMGMRPEGMTLERKDNDKDYEPENCRWATRAEQSLNTRKTTNVTYEGITRTLSEWAQITGIARTTLKARLFVLGYTPEQALTKTVKFGGVVEGKVYKARRKPDMSRCPKGADNVSAKLTASQVIEIRRLYSTKEWTLAALGEMFGVVFQTISLIVNRKTYKEI